MFIEVGQVFSLSDYPKIVGVVTGVKDSKGDSWYVQTTLGDRVVWNNKSKTWRGETDFGPLDETSVLVNECSGTCCCEETTNIDSDVETIDINVGEKWETKCGCKALILSVKDYMFGQEDEIVYTAIIFTENGTDLAFFDEFGKDMIGDYELDFLQDVLFSPFDI